MRYIRLVERDYEIMRVLDRWRCILSRQIKILAGFSGQRAADRRLKLLIEAGYIGRKRIIYGIPSLYFLTNQGKKIMGYSLRPNKIRIEQITHDIYVLDTVIYFLHKYEIPLKSVQSEKELHQIDGFSNRKHRPDFVYIKNGEKYCVEIELSLKAKTRLEKNISDNFINYDFQKWVIPDTQIKIKQILESNSTNYPNIEIIDLSEVTQYVKAI